MIIHDVDQGSEAWFSLRAGLPTASNFSMIIQSDGSPSKSRSKYALTLAGELYAGKPLESWEGNTWTERGKEHEAEAVDRYQFQFDANTATVGFMTTDDGLAGCSPDRLVGDDGLLEIKCLKAERHIEALIYFRKNGRCPTDYIQQTQGQLWISGRRWCDLVFHHPDLPMLVIRQEPILSVIGGLVSGIKAVVAERDSIVGMLKAA